MRLTQLLKNVIPNTPNHGRNMNNLLALFGLGFLTLTGCPYAPNTDCTLPGATCYTGVPADDTGSANGNNGDTDNAPATYDCSNFLAEATAACQAAGGSLLYSECDPETGRNVVLCDTDSDGQSDVNVTVTVNDDGDVTVTTGDDSSADYGSGSGSGGDDTDDTGSGSGSGCVETAGGIEYCDGVDNDCNGVIDDGDFDGDGWISDDCTAYNGTGTNTGDCQDSGSYVGWIHSSLIHPGQLELGDWIDQDCDGNDDASDNNDDGDVTDVGDYSCSTPCDSDSDGDEEFETDGDSAFECVSAFFVADQSADYNPLDDSYTWNYDDGSSVTAYGNVAVSCESSTQSQPTSWSSIPALQTELCTRTPALVMVDCLALF